MDVCKSGCVRKFICVCEFGIHDVCVVNVCGCILYTYVCLGVCMSSGMCMYKCVYEYVILCVFGCMVERSGPVW